MSRIDDNKRIAKNTIALSVRMVIVLFITLFTTRVVLRSLGVEDYGVYNVVCGFVSMFTFLNTSISHGIQRFYNYQLAKNGKNGVVSVYNTALRIQFLLVIILLLFTESFGLWYIRHKMVVPTDRIIASHYIFQFSIFSFLLSILQAPFVASVMAHERMGFFAFISILDAGLKLIIAFCISLANSGSRLILYGFLMMSVSIINIILYVCYARHFYRDELVFKRGFNIPLFKSMLSFSWWNVFGAFASMMKEQGLNLLLNFFFGPIVNAARGIAYQVLSGVKSLLANVYTAIRPQTMQAYALGDMHRTESLMLSMSRMSVLVLYVVSVPIIYEIKFVLALWLGNDYPDHTIPFVILVILIAYINTLNSAVSTVIHATGKMKKYQVVTSLIELLILPVSYLALKLGGEPEFVFIISFVFTAISQIVSLYILRSLVHFSLRKYYYHVIVPCVRVGVLSVLIPSVLLYCVPEGGFRFFVIVFYSISFIPLLCYFFGLTKNEKNLVNRYVKVFFDKLR